MFCNVASTPVCELDDGTRIVALGTRSSYPQRATTSAAAETVPCEVSVLKALLKDFEGDDPHHPAWDKIRAILDGAATPGPRKEDETEGESK